MKFYLAAILLTVFYLNTFAQQGITISGRVLSITDQQPVPSANITVAKRGIGTATNNNGDFTFVIPAANLNDSLRVSCLGFKTKIIAIANLKGGQTLNINLQKTDIELKEVKIEFRDPVKIIQKAIDRIPDNYISTPHVTEGFYRNTTRNGSNYLQLSEAVFDLYNFGYSDKRENLFKLVKARDEKNQRDFKALELGWKPKSIFAEDRVKNIANTDVFSKEGLKRHSFNVDAIVDFKGRQAYEISFHENDGVTEKGYRGRVFIDTQTFAFLYFDYGMAAASMVNEKFGDLPTRMIMKMLNLSISYQRLDSRVSYQQVGDRWVLAGVSATADIKIVCPKLKYDMVANVKFDYVITKVDTTQTKPFDEKLSRNTLIEDHDSDDDNFWKGYNILMPDFNTEAVIAKIRAINSVLRLKDKFIQKEKKLPKDQAVRLDSMLAFYHANGQFNGTALITKNGQIVLSKSYGFADRDKKLSANEHTTYRIGSTAKTFTSLIINQLAAEGKLDISAPIKNYLPWYIHGDITLQQLLTHQSGIPEYFNNDDYKQQMLTQSFALKDIVLKFCSDTLEFKPGTGFSYSNSGFAILALIAQEVSGKPFETLLQERIFNPAQMTDTYAGNYKGTNPHQAIGYSEYAPEPNYNAANTFGAGGIYSSAADMLKYHQALLSDKLLPHAQKLEMLKPRVEFKDYNAFYDYGWMTDKNAFGVSGNKRVITYHPGTDLGFFTMYVREEDTDSCIILFSNTGEFPRYDMTDLILDILY